MRSAGQVWRQMSLFGPEAAHANPSRPLESERESKTPGTFGLCSDVSSRTAGLQSSLESRLRARMAVYGSPEYVLTWRNWDMPHQPPICALRGSARRTSDSGSTGWPTPDSHRHGEIQNEDALMRRVEASKASGAGKRQFNLQDAVKLVGWPTPNAGPQNDNDSTWEDRRRELKAKHGNGNGFGLTLGQAATLCGWATPAARDWKDTPGMAFESTNPDGSKRTRLDLLPRQVYGLMLDSPPAVTGGLGVLNPAHSRWLMGYPETWDVSAPSWKEWDTTQRAFAECSGEPEAFSQWLVATGLAD